MFSLHETCTRRGTQFMFCLALDADQRKQFEKWVNADYYRSLFCIL